jgi:transposase
MDERLQFVARRLGGEVMAELCQEFGISRKTGYKIFDRYPECGVQGLTNRSRRPYRYGESAFLPRWRTTP